MPSEFTESKAFTRRAETADDKPLLLALFTATRSEQFAPLNLPAAMIEAMMRHQLDGQSLSYRAHYPHARHEIIEVDGAPIGRMITDLGEQRLHLVDIIVAPEWSGRGLGSILLGQLMDEARAAGVPVALHVAHDNPRAEALYARLGFETVGSDDTEKEMRWTPRA